MSPRVTTAISPNPRHSNSKDTSLMYSTAGASRPAAVTTYSSTNPSSNNVSGILKQEKDKDQKSKQPTRASSPTGNNIEVKLFRSLTMNIGAPKIYKGPFHVNSISSKSPKYIMSELNRAIDGLKIYYKIVNAILLLVNYNTINY